MNFKKDKKSIIYKAAEEWVFETNGHKWSNNNDEAGDNLGSFIAGCEFILTIQDPTNVNEKISNGDVFNIGQTVNGVDTFLWFNDKWYYFTDRLSREYEYDQEALTNLVKNENDFENITFIKNILSNGRTSNSI